MDDSIDAGALVELSSDEETEYFLLAPSAGGLTVTHQGREITLLTPSSRLYQAMLGGTVGTTLEETGHMVTELE